MSSKDSPVGLTLSVIGIVGAVVLVVSLSLDWYSLSFEGEEFQSISGWSSLEFGDSLFVLILIGSVAAMFTPRRALAFLGLGVVALVFVAVAAATNVPVIELTATGGEIDTSLEAGVFVAAGGVLLLLVAGGIGVAMDAEEGRAGQPEPAPAAPPPA